MRKMATALIWIYKSFHPNCVFDIIKDLSSSLGLILSPNARSIKGMFWSPSFLELDPNVNLTSATPTLKQ
jgi:hypothetical protein